MSKTAIFFSKHKPSPDQASPAALATIDADNLVHVAACDEIDPHAMQLEVQKIAEAEAKKIIAACDETGANVVVLGGGLPELWLYMVPALKKQVSVYTSTTKREVRDLGLDPVTGKARSETLFKHIQYRRIA